VFGFGRLKQFPALFRQAAPERLPFSLVPLAQGDALLSPHLLVVRTLFALEAVGQFLACCRVLGLLG